jgi:uncharacterized protein YndB with AHSA1/START domain
LRADIDITIEVEIDAPREAVWAFVCDLERMPEWLGEFEAARQVSDGAPGLGGVLSYTVRPGPRTGTMQIVEWEPQSKLAWDGPPLGWAGGAMRPRGSFELTDAGKARTHLVGRFQPQLIGTQVLLWPYLTWWMRRHRRADLQKLKSLVEDDAS